MRSPVTPTGHENSGSVPARPGRVSSRAARILAILLILVRPSFGEEWHRFRYGQFEVLSQAGRKNGQQVLEQLVQAHYTVALLLGKQDLKAVWPFQVVVFPSNSEARGHSVGEWKLARDSWMLGHVRNSPLPLGELTRILVESGTQHMPKEVERGLLAVLSTLQVDRTHIKLGMPVPPAERDKAWARIHLLTVSPKYSGRVRVFFANLQQGADWHSTYKNAFETTPEAIDAEVDRYLEAGSFPVREISGAPVTTRDFSARDFDQEYVETALADLLNGDAARASYEHIVAGRAGWAPALEGLGKYQEAVQAGSRSARCWVEFGKAIPQPARARAAWVRAAQLNSRWALPYALMAGVDTNLPNKIRDLDQAARLEPRNANYWQQLAKAYQVARQYTKATQAWGGAMRAAKSPEERERYYQARLAVEDLRGDRFSTERRNRIEDRELERRRQREEWQELLERNRAAGKPSEQGGKSEPDVVEWWDDPRPKGNVSGVLKQVDCIRGVARLIVEADDGKRVRLVVRKPSEIVLSGGGETTLGCGVQNPERRVSIEYYKEEDPGLKTVGEAGLIEFR